MLNACPTLSWKDKSFRPRSLNTIRAGSRAAKRCIGDGWGERRGRGAQPWYTLDTSVVGTVLGYWRCLLNPRFGPGVICSSLDQWVWFVWGITRQLVRNRYESPSLLDSEHLTQGSTPMLFCRWSDILWLLHSLLVPNDGWWLDQGRWSLYLLFCFCGNDQTMALCRTKRVCYFKTMKLPLLVNLVCNNFKWTPMYVVNVVNWM